MVCVIVSEGVLPSGIANLPCGWPWADVDRKKTKASLSW